MTEATDDNQAINVVYLYDRSNQWQPSYKCSVSIWQKQPMTTKLYMLCIYMTEATNDNQAINVVYPYDRSNQWQPSYKCSVSIWQKQPMTTKL